ncbi:MAG: N-acetyltransferase [candidate division KSB1 bacterium]|nr:N-acetyltransferase [candidate division KSB1 bacterium]MDZ7367013.1 N-acetyltransferase [candidate division KSB1 bacterium]
MSKNQENTVRNNTADRRFELMIEGKLSMIEYLMADENTAIVFAHTEVPEELEGRGIASRLAKAALEFAKSKELAVIPLCPFVKSYIHRHPEYQPLVK